MKIILITLKKILFWSYERGSWQYDVMCVLILAFIFLSPNGLFQSRGESMPHTVRGGETAEFESKRSPRLEAPLQQSASNAVRVSRIETLETGLRADDYIAWRKTFLESVQFTEKQHETK